MLAVQSAGWLLYAAGLMAAIAFVVVRASARRAISLGTVLMTVSLIRRSRAQLASAASGSAGMIATLATADRLLWLEDHHAAAVAAAGTAAAPGPADVRDSAPRPVVQVPGHAAVGAFLAHPHASRRGDGGDRGGERLGQDHARQAAARHVPADVGHDRRRRRPAGLDLPTRAGGNGARPRSRTSPGSACPRSSRWAWPTCPSCRPSRSRSAALDRAGAAELSGQLPSGLSTYVGGPYTGGHNLSGGQWQKLALGRAMRSPDPLLVVLDEPTASLDAHAEQALFDRYAAAAAAYAARSGTITLLVSHRFATVRMADLIIYLEEGHAAEAGTHDELLASGGPLRGAVHPPGQRLPLTLAGRFRGRRPGAAAR